MKKTKESKITSIVRLSNNCNLACKYCYVIDKSNNLIQNEALEKIIHESATITDNVNYLWHGGEPLLAGLDTFKQICEIQDKLGEDIKITNKIQTNGILLDKKFLSFFKRKNFKIGLSLDGPEKLHDAMRVFPDGSGTHKKVMRSINLMKKMHMDFGCILILNKTNYESITQIYDFYNKEKIRFKLNPVILEINSPYGITAAEYGTALIRLYDHMKGVENGINCKTIDYLRNGVTKGCTEECTYQKDCHKHFVGFDTNGDVYPCNRFVGHKRMAMGNIHKKHLTTIFKSDKYMKLERKPKKLGCNLCYWKNICNGGCGYESYTTYGTLHSKTSFCESYKMIFEHIASREGAVMTEQMPF